MRATGSYYVVDAKRKQEEPFLASRLPSSKTRTTFVQKKEGDGGGPQKLHVSTGLQATLTLKLSVAKRHRTRRCQTNALFAGTCPWKWERSWKAATYRMTQFLTSTARERERERERQRARVRAWEQLQLVRQSAGLFFCCCLRFVYNFQAIHQLQLQRSFVE